MPPKRRRSPAPASLLKAGPPAAAFSDEWREGPQPRGGQVSCPSHICIHVFACTACSRQLEFLDAKHGRKLHVDKLLSPPKCDAQRSPSKSGLGKKASTEIHSVSTVGNGKTFFSLIDGEADAECMWAKTSVQAASIPEYSALLDEHVPKKQQRKFAANRDRAVAVALHGSGAKTCVRMRV